MELAIQIIVLLLIVVIGYLIFKTYKETLDFKGLVLTSMFVLISVILSAYLSFRFGFAGGSMVVIGFSQLPLILMGALLGPAWGFIGAVAQDLILLFVSPTGFPFAGFTLNKIMVTLIPAFWFRSKKIEGKALVLLSQLLIAFSYVSTIILLFQEGDIVIESLVINTFWKVLLAIILFVLMGGLIYAIYYIYNKDKDNPKYKDMSLLIISIVSVEILVQYLMTPFWLNIMYKTPYLTNLMVRLLKGGFMIILNVLISTNIYFILDKLIVSMIRKKNTDKSVDEIEQ